MCVLFLRWHCNLQVQGLGTLSHTFENFTIFGGSLHIVGHTFLLNKQSMKQMCEITKRCRSRMTRVFQVLISWNFKMNIQKNSNPIKMLQKEYSGFGVWCSRRLKMCALNARRNAHISAILFIVFQCSSCFAFLQGMGALRLQGSGSLAVAESELGPQGSEQVVRWLLGMNFHCVTFIVGLRTSALSFGFWTQTASSL